MGIRKLGKRIHFCLWRPPDNSCVFTSGQCGLKSKPVRRYCFNLVNYIPKMFFFTLEIISFNNFSCWGLYSSWCISCLQSFNCYRGVSGVKWFFLCLRVLFSLSQLLQHHTYCSGIQEGNSAESQCCAQVCISHTVSSAPTAMPVLTCRLINTLKWCFLSLDQNLASYP